MKRTIVGLVLMSFALFGCGGGSGKSNTLIIGASDPPPRAVVKAWPDKWCEAQTGITKDALYKIMGKPTQESSTDASWDAYEYQFNAFFDVDGNVRQLDINDIELSSSEKALLRCDTTRIAP